MRITAFHYNSSFVIDLSTLNQPLLLDRHDLAVHLDKFRIYISINNKAVFEKRNKETIKNIPASSTTKMSVSLSALKSPKAATIPSVLE